MKIISGISFKLKKTACEMWNLIRFVPLIIGNKIDEGNKVWGCLLKFVILVERLSSSSFSKSDLAILEVNIADFFLSYQENFPTANIKPKSHFLRHYPNMIRRFGLLVKTLRFESKDQYFKSLSQMTKRRKNMCQSLAK